MTLADRALAILADGPARPYAVAHAAGCSTATAQNALHYLHATGRIVRLRRGVYALPGDKRPLPPARWAASPERPGAPEITAADCRNIDQGAEIHDLAASLAGTAGSGLRVEFGGTDESATVECAALGPVTAQRCIEGYVNATSRGHASPCLRCHVGARRRLVYALDLEPTDDAVAAVAGGDRMRRRVRR